MKCHPELQFAFVNVVKSEGQNGRVAGVGLANAQIPGMSADAAIKYSDPMSAAIHGTWTPLGEAVEEVPRRPAITAPHVRRGFRRSYLQDRNRL